jgi:hypothetical protein
MWQKIWVWYKMLHISANIVARSIHTRCLRQNSSQNCTHRRNYRSHSAHIQDVNALSLFVFSCQQNRTTKVRKTNYFPPCRTIQTTKKLCMHSYKGEYIQRGIIDTQTPFTDTWRSFADANLLFPWETLRSEKHHSDICCAITPGNISDKMCRWRFLPKNMYREKRDVKR